MKRQSPPGTTFEEKLALYTVRDPVTGCLNWTAGLTRGYGQHGTPGHKTKLVHVSVWELHHGPRPAGAVVRHRCHNTRCCEVTHLAIGTQADNIQDMWDADRAATGVRLPHTKLTDSQVRAIREDARPMRQIADEFGIHYQTVFRLKKGLRRAHVD
jgi:hypothetical protein